MVRMIPPGPSRQPTRLSARQATLLASMACSARSERCQPPVGLWAPTPGRSNSAAPDDLKSRGKGRAAHRPFLQIRLGTAWINAAGELRFARCASGLVPDNHSWTHEKFIEKLLGGRMAAIPTSRSFSSCLGMSRLSSVRKTWQPFASAKTKPGRRQPTLPRYYVSKTATSYRLTVGCSLACISSATAARSWFARSSLARNACSSSQSVIAIASLVSRSTNKIPPLPPCSWVKGTTFSRKTAIPAALVPINVGQRKRSPGFGRGNGLVPRVAAHFGYARAQESGGPPSWSARRAAAESLVLRHLIAGDVVLRHHVRPVHVRVDGLSVGESGRIETGRTARLLR